METVIVLICCGLAVWYLYRKFAKTIKSDQASCGCAGCDACAVRPDCDTKKPDDRV